MRHGPSLGRFYNLFDSCRKEDYAVPTNGTIYIKSLSRIIIQLKLQWHLLTFLKPCVPKFKYYIQISRI